VASNLKQPNRLDYYTRKLDEKNSTIIFKKLLVPKRFQRTGGGDMEMDMSEPGEMCCWYDEEHDLAKTEILLQLKTRLHATVGRIIIYYRGINQSS
jgi:hypothetical protein